MSSGTMTLLGLGILLVILAAGSIISSRFYRREDRKVERANEEILDKATLDNQRLATECAEALSALVDYFSTYLRFRDSEKASREAVNAALELSVLWEKLPEDARKLLLPFAEPPLGKPLGQIPKTRTSKSPRGRS